MRIQSGLSCCLLLVVAVHVPDCGIPLSFSLVSVSMGLSACNSSGHLSNHADIAPHHAGITYAISNTLVSSDLLLFRQSPALL